MLRRWACGLMILAAAPLWAAGPETRAADEPPKVVLRAFFRAVMAGDEKKMHALVVYGDPEMQNAGDTLLRLVIIEQQLREVTNEVLGAPNKETGIGMSDAAMADVEKDFDTAQVKAEGGRAKVVLSSGATYVLVLKEGSWKLDFDKTQAGMGGIPPPAELLRDRKKIAAVDQLIQDVRGHKYSSAEEVAAEFKKITDEPGPATTMP